MGFFDSLADGFRAVGNTVTSAVTGFADFAQTQGGQTILAPFAQAGAQALLQKITPQRQQMLAQGQMSPNTGRERQGTQPSFQVFNPSAGNFQIPGAILNANPLLSGQSFTIPPGVIAAGKNVAVGALGGLLGSIFGNDERSTEPGQPRVSAGGGNVAVLPGGAQTGGGAVGFPGGAAPLFNLSQGGRVSPRSLVMTLNPANGNPVFFRHVGRPVLYSGDLATCKRVKKISARVRRSVGGR